MSNYLISVDSVKIRIPSSLVDILSLDFEQIFSVRRLCDNIEVDQFKKNRYQHIENGIKTSYGSESQGDGYKLGVVTNYIVILINAKLLEERYFEGITKDNVRLVYDKIIGQGVVHFEYDDFMKSTCTDIDFKKDVLCNDLNLITKDMERHTKPSKSIDRGCKRYKSKKNKGIQYGIRKRSTAGYPYLKVYDKTIELTHKSTEFSELHDLDYPSNLVRIEFQIKDKEHLQRYGLTEQTLEGILDIDQDKLSSILTNILSIHLEKRTKTPLMRENLTPIDQTIYGYTVICLGDGHTLPSLLDALTENMNKDQRYSMKKKITYIYDHHIKHQDIGKINESVSGFFDQIGWH